MAATGKSKILTLDDRVDVLKRIDNGESCRSIAAAVNCGKTQISRIRNDRAAIMKEWESGARCDLKYVKRRKGTYSPRHKHWPAGPAHFSDRRTSSGQYILSVTGPYGPPRYMSGHQISNSAGPNDDNSQYVFFARSPVPHLGSFRAALLLQRDASVSRVRVGHVKSNTLFRSRGTSTRTSGTHPGTFLREAHVMVPSKQFCVLVG